MWKREHFILGLTLTLTGTFGQYRHCAAIRSNGTSAATRSEQPNDGSGRLFVVSQSGTIQIIQNGAVLPMPFLDIHSLVIDSSESGLLGLTFHPGFPQNPRFYVNYVRSNAGQIQSVIAEFQVSPASPNQADPATERILLVVNQVHNFS